MTIVVLAVMVLAVARLTRLVTTDDITEPWRARVMTHQPLGSPTWFARMIVCNWCVGIWVALVAAVVARLTGLVTTWVWAVWAWFAVAGGSGLLLGWDR